MAARGKGSQHAALHAGILELIEKVIGESDLALLARNRLSGDLAGILRVKKGRFRLFYILATEKVAARVLYVGFRKEGDKRDAYEEFRRYLRAGVFDPQFAELGLKKPAR
jgi:hypothetical protein